MNKAQAADQTSAVGTAQALYYAVAGDPNNSSATSIIKTFNSR